MKLLKLFLVGCGILAMTSLEAQNLKTKMDSVSYSFGILIANNLKSQGLTEINAAALAQGVDDFLKGKNTVTVEQAGTIYQSSMESMNKKKHEKNIGEGKKFLDENKKRKGVVTLPSGLQYEVMKEGRADGKSPKATDKVKTHYHGTLLDGSVFDSSVQRGEPIEFPVNGVIKGWTEALQLMKEGAKWKLFIPYDLAYGERGAGGQIGPYATLVFEVELIAVTPN